MQEIIQIGTINVVKTINNIEIPSIPNLNFIESFIHDFSSTNWNSDEVKSKEYQTNSARMKFAKLVNKERYIAPLLFLRLLVIKIKKELKSGKNIKVDKMGKFILFQY